MLKKLTITSYTLSAAFLLSAYATSSVFIRSITGISVLHGLNLFICGAEMFFISLILTCFILLYRVLNNESLIQPIHWNKDKRVIKAGEYEHRPSAMGSARRVGERYKR